MNITVVGAGYVGLSIATLLSQNNKVYLNDIDDNKLDLIGDKVSPISDSLIDDYLKNKDLNLIATNNLEEAIKQSQYVIICTPTNYNPIIDSFDTCSIENVIESVLNYNRNICIVIKSTVPIGYTRFLIDKYNFKNIIFSPEFSRENNALYDNLYPDRIVIGYDENNNDLIDAGFVFSNLLKEGAIKENIDVLFMDSSEAEAVKLFSNTYLAMRVSYFNELDTYCESKGLNTKNIIEGVCSDHRIGKEYNNPSFGYGGYCLPKDSKQLLSNYKGIKQSLIKAVVDSNQIRKEYIAEQILNKLNENNGTIIGIYRLIMKANSDNFRESSIQGVIECLKRKSDKLDIILYEPNLLDDKLYPFTLVNNLEEFKNKADIIVVNRYDNKLDSIKRKVYTRSIYDYN